MEDAEIIDLYWQRDQRAIDETHGKYGGFLTNIAWNILRSHGDAEECVNDTYLRTWNAIPPARPSAFRAWLGRIVRNLSLDRWRYNRAAKRGGGQVEALTQELSDCVTGSPELLLEAAELSRLLDKFLRTLPQKERCVFLRRYWYCDSISDIAAQCHMASGTVKSSLHRTRGKLKRYLQEEGIFV